MTKFVLATIPNTRLIARLAQAHMMCRVPRKGWSAGLMSISGRAPLRSAGRYDGVRCRYSWFLCERRICRDVGGPIDSSSAVCGYRGVPVVQLAQSHVGRC